uniref:Ig-like domain-containing protein n=1 Tax=Scleropages formosus TaxID=113540 RepID=A0A8C9TWW4_SCLFO
MATLISGESPFPEFSMLLKVNDIPVEYGDSVVNGTARSASPYRVRWTNTPPLAAQSRTVFDQRLLVFFSGIRVYQTLTACDETKFVIVDAYDGEEVRSYDFQQHTFHARLPEILWTKVQMEATKVASTNVFHPLCVRTLKRYLVDISSVADPTERPRVRVIRKTEPDSGRTRVSCVATGFYPRRVNVTLLRDDRPVPDRELTGGEVLPNGDGTYQLRRSLSVSEEELRERHRYTCTVSHLSVDNKLDVNWGKTPVRLDSEAPADTVLVSAVLIAVLGLTALIIITATVLWRRRRHAGEEDEGCGSMMDGSVPPILIHYRVALCNKTTLSSGFFIAQQDTQAVLSSPHPVMSFQVSRVAVDQLLVFSTVQPRVSTAPTV